MHECMHADTNTEREREKERERDKHTHTPMHPHTGTYLYVNKGIQLALIHYICIYMIPARGPQTVILCNHCSAIIGFPCNLCTQIAKHIRKLVLLQYFAENVAKPMVFLWFFCTQIAKNVMKHVFLQDFDEHVEKPLFFLGFLSSDCNLTL